LVNSSEEHQTNFHQMSTSFHSLKEKLGQF
jgi:hypothetical protein